MRQGFFNRKYSSTAFVLLDVKKCEACWKCLEVCTKNVIGRIILPWHKHVRFINGTACVGCLMCVKSCSTGAISKLDKK